MQARVAATEFKEFPWHEDYRCVKFDFDLKDMNVGQDHDTTLGHGYIVIGWIIIQIRHDSKNLEHRHIFSYVCNVNLTLVGCFEDLRRFSYISAMMQEITTIYNRTFSGLQGKRE